jgi:hypothetical protein
MAKKVSFWATKRVPRRVRVSFRSSSGKRVSFTGTKRVPKRVRVSFWATSRRRSR